MLEEQQSASESRLVFGVRPMNPLYFVQPHDGSERPGIALLLGAKLQTISTTLRKISNDGGKQSLLVRNDFPEGVNSRRRMDPPTDAHFISTFIGGPIGSFEAVYSLAKDFECRILDASQEEKPQLEIEGLRVLKPTLIISRRTLRHSGVAQELEHGKNVNPHYGPVTLIHHSFGELIDQVRSLVWDGRYVLIDR